MDELVIQGGEHTIMNQTDSSYIQGSNILLIGNNSIVIQSKANISAKGQGCESDLGKGKGIFEPYFAT